MFAILLRLFAPRSRFQGLMASGALDPNDDNSTESVTDNFDVTKAMHLANECDASQTGHACVRVCEIKAGHGYDPCADMYGFS